MGDQDVSCGTFLELLLKWNEKINLVSKSNTKEMMWDRHIEDSKSLIDFIDFEDVIVDVGSGAGFPGVVLSICGAKNVILVESDERKAAFLLQASKISGNKIEILNQRVENLELKCDILTSRAFASIDDILNLCHNIEVRKKVLLLKGNSVMMEIEDALKNWHFKYQMHKKNNGWIIELDYDNSDCKPKRRGR